MHTHQIESKRNGPTMVKGKLADDAGTRLEKEVSQQLCFLRPLTSQVQALRARIARRDETITKLQSQASTSASRADLDSKVDEIVKRHEASKAKVCLTYSRT